MFTPLLNVAPPLKLASVPTVRPPVALIEPPESVTPPIVPEVAEILLPVIAPVTNRSPSTCVPAASCVIAVVLSSTVVTLSGKFVKVSADTPLRDVTPVTAPWFIVTPSTVVPVPTTYEIPVVLVTAPWISVTFVPLIWAKFVNLPPVNCAVPSLIVVP